MFCRLVVGSIKATFIKFHLLLLQIAFASVITLLFVIFLYVLLFSVMVENLRYE